MMRKGERGPDASRTDCWKKIEVVPAPQAGGSGRGESTTTSSFDVCGKRLDGIGRTRRHRADRPTTCVAGTTNPLRVSLSISRVPNVDRPDHSARTIEKRRQ